MSNFTKIALAQCLKDMIEEKTLDHVTVKELVERCGIKRQTFYYHFSDIYDLVEWIYTMDAEEAIGENKTYDTWTEGYLQVFKYIQKNKKFVLNTYKCVSRDYLERYLYEVVFDMMIGVVEEVSKGKGIKQEDKIFIANFYKFAFVGIIVQWIDTGMKESPDRLIEKTNCLIEGDIEKMIGKVIAR